MQIRLECFIQLDWVLRRHREPLTYRTAVGGRMSTV
jgi:hypothetical protein